ncbi:MAG: hypothetical protein AAGN82_17025 [Myxococcota bacterium]
MNNSRRSSTATSAEEHGGDASDDGDRIDPVAADTLTREDVRAHAGVMNAIHSSALIRSLCDLA